MEYVQLTMADYLQSKEEIKKDLGGIVKSFVRIGWQLNRIDKSHAYEMEGYKSIAEFAKAEYDMNPDGVTRFIKVYEKYSVPGDTPELQERYRDFKFSQLTEMLQISEEDREMFEPEAKRESIREFRKFQKENESNPDNLLNWKAEPENVLEETIFRFFKAHREFLNGVYEKETLKEAVELINPSGNSHYRYNTVFLMMYDLEKGIRVCEFGKNPENMTWKNFFELTKKIFGEGAGEQTWEKCFGETTGEDEQIPGQDSILDHPEYMPQPEESSEPIPEKKIAPAQKTEEQKYSEKQNRIDRETKKKLEEQEDEEKMNHLPSDAGQQVYQLRLPGSCYEDTKNGIKTFELRKKEKEYRKGDILELMEFTEGRHTGRVIRAEITYILDDYTGLEEGYCIMAIHVLSAD